MEEKKQGQKKKRTTLFELLYRTRRDGKEVKKEPIGPPTLANFFKFYGRHFYDAVKVNLLLVFGNFPVFFGLFALTGYLNHNASAASSYLFSPLYGAMTADPEHVSPLTMLLYGIHGVQTEGSTMSVATYIFFGLSALVIFTFGIVNTGVSYILRNMVRGEPIFFWQDFTYAVKRNFRQGMILGILDCAVIGVLFYNITFTYFNLGRISFNVSFFGNTLLAVVYFVMRYYLYIMLVTFDLSIFKLFKNAFIFVILGFRRNFMAVLGTVCAVAVTYSLLIVFQPVGMLLPFTILFGTGAVMGAYAAYPKIKQIMIDPYYKSDKPGSEPITDAPSE